MSENKQKLSETNYSNLFSASMLIKFVLKDDNRMPIKIELQKIIDKITKVMEM